MYSQGRYAESKITKNCSEKYGYIKEDQIEISQVSESFLESSA